jgi:hypothetical protein
VGEGKGNCQKSEHNKHFLLSAAKHGVGLYFGDMRYKERVFVEKLFRSQLIKVVVSSDAWRWE